MVIWLAIFSPVVCEYHGLMLKFSVPEPMPAASQHEMHHHGDMPMESSGTTDSHISGPTFRTLTHRMLTEDMQSMSLLIAVTPDHVLIAPLRVIAAAHPGDRHFPVQRSVPPPEQPPRLTLRFV